MVRLVHHILAALAIALALPAAVAAQDAQGIAIAQSPQESFHACHGPVADDTLNCARRKCREAGGTNCLRVRWCYPAGFSGAMSYLANREITEVTFVCGAPSEAALMRMLAALCASDSSATECRLFVLWTPDGTESERTDLLGKNSSF